MGRNAQQRRGDDGVKVDHLILDPETYLNIRRFLGSRPHDETRQLIDQLERLSIVTADDIAHRERASKRLAELEGMAADMARIDAGMEQDAHRFRWICNNAWDSEKNAFYIPCDWEGGFLGDFIDGEIQKLHEQFLTQAPPPVGRDDARLRPEPGELADLNIETMDEKGDPAGIEASPLTPAGEAEQPDNLEN